MALTEPNADLVRRFARREPSTQSLAFAAGLQDRGWACLLAGSAFVAVQQRKDGLHARMQRPVVLDLRQIDSICERLPIHQFVIEPALTGVIVDRAGCRRAWDYQADADCFSPLLELGWQPRRRSLTHTKTSVIDLAQGLQAATSAFSTAARRNTRAAAKADVVYRDIGFDAVTADEREQLRALNLTFLQEHPDLQDSSVVRASVATHFGSRGRYVMALHGSRLVGVVYLLIHDRVASYYVAQAAREAQSLRVPTGLVHASIRVALEHGCDLFDFVGVQDERFPKANASWGGFTEFKERFGGQVVYLPAGLDIALHGGPRSPHGGLWRTMAEHPL